MVMDSLDFLDSPDSGKPGLNLAGGDPDFGLGPARMPLGMLGMQEPAPEPELPLGKRKNDLIDFLEALNIPQFLPLFTVSSKQSQLLVWRLGLWRQLASNLSAACDVKIFGDRLLWCIDLL